MTTSPLYRSPEGERLVMALYDGVLGNWPLPFDGLTVDTRHGATYVIASGPASAPPLVLLHGACSNAVSWVGDVAEYGRHFRVHAVDLPGEPGRSAPNRPAWRGAAFAEWLGDVLDGLSLARVSVVGLSQGGWVALKFASAAPESIERLVLLAPGGVAPARASFLLRAVPLTLLGRRGAEAINRITFGSQQIYPAAVEFMDAIMTHFRPRIEPQPLLTDAELARLTMPTLLVVGARDALLPSGKIAARLQRLAPRLSTTVLPHAGHALVGLAPAVTPFLLGADGK